MISRAILKRSHSLTTKLCRDFASIPSLVNFTVNDKTGIATLELNRPPINSLNTVILKEISAVIDELTKDHSRGMILTSSSKTVFSGGIDLMELYKPVPEKARLFWTCLQEVWLKLYGSSFPTAAAINGHSPAGGCLLALCCEYRVMLPNFTIGLNETKLGIIPPAWFQASMRNVLPVRQAEKALTLGTIFTTDEAYKIGLVDEIAADEADALERCEKFFQQFAKISPNARALTKQIFRGKDLADMVKNREEDLRWFSEGIVEPQYQKLLEKYLQNMKTKK